MALEKEGRYVFHGSMKTIPQLEPQQAYNRDNTSGEMVKDGEPAVFATPFADVAIYRALINTEGMPGASSNRFAKDGSSFQASQNLVDRAKTITGKVYVLPKHEFTSEDGLEFRATHSQTPLEVIDVTADHLPPNITIIDPRKKT